MEVSMSVRLALAVLLSALSATSSDALLKGYEISDLPKDDNFLDYALIKNNGRHIIIKKSTINGQLF